MIVHGAMLIEPTEGEKKPNLDQYYDCLRGLMKDISDGKSARFVDAPILTPRLCVDEAKAARNVTSRWP